MSPRSRLRKNIERFSPLQRGKNQPDNRPVVSAAGANPERNAKRVRD